MGVSLGLIDNLFIAQIFQGRCYRFTAPTYHLPHLLVSSIFDSGKWLVREFDRLSAKGVKLVTSGGWNYRAFSTSWTIHIKYPLGQRISVSIFRRGSSQL